MSNTRTPVKERRTSSHQLIKKFVEERTRMLSLYSDLAATHPYKDTASVSVLLTRFCEALIDYTADAHFRLYRYIDDRRERRGNVKEIAGQVYPVIINTTQDILDFNDKYDAFDHEIHVDGLETDLSLLGEKLADRIELEDRVIEALVAGYDN
jgi:regulator of sigma D